MNKKFIVSDILDQTGLDGNNPIIINSDPHVVDKIPMGADLINEEPIDGTFVAIDPEGEIVVYETPNQGETNAASAAALLSHEVSERLRARWNEVQGSFVDEPRSAVKQADALVAEVIEKITQLFAIEHGLLEGLWKQEKDVTTEDLRKALQSYRSLFNRLVV